MLKRVTLMMTAFIAVVVVGAYVAYAIEEEGQEFSTEEIGNSILKAEDGQKQVREIRLKEQQEARILAEKKAEEERKKQEAIKEEERRVAEAIAKKEQEAANEKSTKPATSNKQAASAPEQMGSNLGTFEATAYGPDCVGCSGITANGTDIRNGNIYSGGYRVIAADPRVIPMNSIVKITYSSGQTEMAKVCDTGGAIKGKIIDIAFASEAETPAFGRQQVQIELIN